MKKINPNDRLGVVRSNNFGTMMEVVEYKNSHNIIVKFESGNYTSTNWYDFIRGTIKNVYDKTIFGIGYIGEGKHKPSFKGKESRCYRTWCDMLKRCYNVKFLEKFPTYIGCSVAEEWQNFQKFANWYDDNYYTIEGERMHLDKDILHKGNKVYSPTTCKFVPSKINGLFVKSNAKRGNLPIGVRSSVTNNKYIAQCLDGNKIQKYIGTFSNPEDAYLAYKKYKEELIKQVAEEYKNKIPQQLFEAMMNYIVEIDD